MNNNTNSKTIKLFVLTMFIGLFFSISSCKKDENIAPNFSKIEGTWSLVSTKYTSYINGQITEDSLFNNTEPTSITFSDGSYVKRIDNKIDDTGKYTFENNILSLKNLKDSVNFLEVEVLNNTTLVTKIDENYKNNNNTERYIVEFNYSKAN